MPKIFQINICLNLSTGKIAQQIGEAAMRHGWVSWIAFSGREKFQISTSRSFKVGNFVDACLHYAGQKAFDKEGLFSARYTRLLIKKLEDIKPDIIQLHNIHDHWLNYPILFEYFSTLDTPVIWVQHDCWAFTGGCMYFDMLKCDRWKDGCKECPDKRTILKNQSIRNYNLKKKYLDKIKNLIFVPVSDWLANSLKESAQGYRPIITIHNGADLNVFKPLEKNPSDNKFRIIGVASTWDARKGLNDFVKLRGMLSYEYEITLVGLAKKQIKGLPSGIRGISRTSNAHELAKLYSDSDVFVNPTYSDNFPTTNIEALACGTPVITYKTGGSPEAIRDEGSELQMVSEDLGGIECYPTGMVVEQGNVESLAEAIKLMREHPLSSEGCRKRAEEHFDKDKCFEKYIDLYEELLKVKS